jgi:hypothetical protein
VKTKSPTAFLLLGLSWPLAFLVMQFVAPIAQDPTYHDFANTGAWWGVPNFWNVFTNLALVIAGAVGLRSIYSQRTLRSALGETLFFVGLLLTGFGSAYYHYAPDNQTLLWDRLPMTVAFMALYVALLGHCFDRQLAQRFLPLALLTGAASVLYWSYSESRGAGDLRYYAVVQFLPMLLIPTLLLRWPPKALRVSYLWSMLLLYLAAKLCEYFDDTLAGHLPFLLTGHALKHLFSGAAGFVFVGARSHAQISPQE